MTGSRDYTAFGAVTAQSGTGLDRYGYTAREWDASIGLQYGRARMYDPGTGRWTGEDPAGFAAGDANLHRYAGNNATGRTDPSGMDWSLLSILKGGINKDQVRNAVDGVRQAVDAVRSVGSEVMRRARGAAVTGIDAVRSTVTAESVWTNLKRFGRGLLGPGVPLEGFDPTSLLPSRKDSIRQIFFGPSVPTSEWRTLLGPSIRVDEAGEAWREGRVGEELGRATIELIMTWLAGRAISPMIPKGSAPRPRGPATERCPEAPAQAKRTPVTPKPNCFPTGTVVVTELGVKPIEAVQPGDRVRSFDFRTGEWVVCQVAVRDSAEYEGEVLTLDCDDGSQLEVTADHPIWVMEGDGLSDRPQLKFRDAYEDSGLSLPGRWVHSQRLRVGDQLYAITGRCLTVRGIGSRADRLTVHNLSVLGHPYYAVGPLGILVHNTETAVQRLFREAEEALKAGDIEKAIRLEQEANALAAAERPAPAAPTTVQPQLPSRAVDRMTGPQAREAASANGWTEVANPGLDSHGQLVFTDGKSYFSPDNTVHTGGGWKQFNKRGQRIATLDNDLNKIGK